VLIESPAVNAAFTFLYVEYVFIGGKAFFSEALLRLPETTDVNLLYFVSSIF